MEAGAGPSTNIFDDEIEQLLDEVASSIANYSEIDYTQLVPEPFDESNIDIWYPKNGNTQLNF